MSTPPQTQPSTFKEKEKEKEAKPGSPSRARSSSRNKDAAKTPANQSGSHQRKTIGRGGGGRRGSHGAATAVKKDKDGATPPPTTSDGLNNLKNLISELKDAPASSVPTSHSPAASPSRSKAVPHRKNSAGTLTNTPTIVAPPPPSSSTLNPNAGGFQPTMLGSISDMMDEGLITPTASQFDLMTGLPRNHVGGFRNPPPQFVGQTSELPEEVPGFGGVAGMNARAFSFPPASQQQQHFLLQQQQQHAQQQFQIQQMTNMGLGVAGAPTGAGGTAAELVQEQMNIQAQLETLRVAQENLLQRFGDMQMAGGDGVASPLLGSGQQQVPQGHRRGSSQQVGGAMGSFGQGSMGSFGQGGFGTGGVGTGNLPKGHGRRHSVNVGHSKSPSVSNTTFTSPSIGASPSMSSQSAFSPPMNQTMSPPMGFGSFGGGFQFPPNGSQQGQGHHHRGSLGGESDFGPSGQGNGSFGHHRRQSGSMSSNAGGWSSSTSACFLFRLLS